MINYPTKADHQKIYTGIGPEEAQRIWDGLHSNDQLMMLINYDLAMERQRFLLLGDTKIAEGINIATGILAKLKREQDYKTFVKTL